ncbi:hypothetical protein [Micromonospora tulbaghiae]|uniref:hypothetical protein n=1 Tax=Micromonospora tulbaghiae TaxID=479978 RepID=UPI0033ECED82
MNPDGVDVRELGRLIGRLPRLKPLERARLARELVDVAKVVLSKEADAAVVEALESMTYRQVAEGLGKSTASVNKAVSRHRNPGMRERRQ